MAAIRTQPTTSERRERGSNEASAFEPGSLVKITHSGPGCRSRSVQAPGPGSAFGRRVPGWTMGRSRSVQQCGVRLAGDGHSLVPHVGILLDLGSVCRVESGPNCAGRLLRAPIPASRLSHGRDDVDVQPAAAGRPRPSVTGEHAEARPSTDWLWRIKLTNGQGPIRTGLSLKSQVFRITRADGSTPAPHQFRSHAELAGESRSPRPRREEANE